MTRELTAYSQTVANTKELEVNGNAGHGSLRNGSILRKEVAVEGVSNSDVSGNVIGYAYAAKVGP